MAFIGPLLPGRKRSRKRYGKKSYYKRRKAVSNRRYKDFIYDAIKLNGVQRHRAEIRNAGLENPTNLVTFNAFRSMNDRADIELYLQTTIGESGNELSGGTYSTDIYNKQWYLYNYNAMNKIRNVGEHDAWLTIYECVAKKNRTLNDATYSTTRSLIMNDIVNGWKDKMGAGASTLSTKSGENIISFTPGNATCDTYSRTIHPKESKEFLHNWKILSQKTFKLNPGDDVQWTIKMKNFMWNPMKWKDTGNNQVDIYAGKTKVFLMKYNGSMGRSTAAGEEDIVGLMQADLAVETFQSGNVTQVQTSQAELHHTLYHDDLTGKTLGAGVDVEMKDDVN